MKNIDKLENAVSTKFKPFTDAIWIINLIDELINKPEFEPEIRELVNSFKSCYTILMNEFKITMSNKIHIICDHLPDYLEENKKTLLKTTDQTIESTHSKLDSFLKTHGYFRKNMDDPSTGEKLLNGLVAWNSYVLGEKNVR